jgi:hypothetical protein
MKSNPFPYLLLILIVVLLNSCGPKSISTDRQKIQDASKEWIPFNGEESVVFVHDTNKIVFNGSGKETYYENIRYMTDQGSFIAVQEDYYADFERQYLDFYSNSTNYDISYYLERDKGDAGDWDLLKIIMADGNFYKNELKIAVYNPSEVDLGEIYQYKKTLTLNGNQYDSVYFWKQDQRPFEVYYTKRKGVIAFKLSSQEIWTLEPDSIP